MPDTPSSNLAPPRKVQGPALLIMGTRARYAVDSVDRIAQQWRDFPAMVGAIAGRVGGVSYGVCCAFDESGHFDYVCGVEVTRADDPPPGLRVVRIPARPYCIFRHEGHVSGIGATWRAIMNDYPPSPGYHAEDAASFERYAEDFDGRTGLGGVEIWIPIGA